MLVLDSKTMQYIPADRGNLKLATEEAVEKDRMN